MGIPQEKLGSVFESFKQVDSSINKKFGGTGLGLTITKQFCDMLGIEIGVNSELGRGSTFWLRIPAEEAAADQNAPAFLAEEAAVPALQPSPTLSQSVLVVDDDEINLQVAGDILKMGGYGLYKALSAEEGLRIARKMRPDVILMDLAMPDMDGIEASHILKTDAETARIPIIACTAHVTQETRDRAFQAGCDAFVSRPIEPKKLLMQIAKILEKHS